MSGNKTIVSETLPEPAEKGPARGIFSFQNPFQNLWLIRHRFLRHIKGGILMKDPTREIMELVIAAIIAAIFRGGDDN